MEVKKYLLDKMDAGEQLKRNEVFPFYMNQHRQAKIQWKLRTDIELSEPEQ